MPWALSCRLCTYMALEADRVGMRQAHLSLPHSSKNPAASHLAKFSVTLRNASCFLALFLAAASLAIFRPRRSLRPGSKIYKAAGMWVTCAGSVTWSGTPLSRRPATVPPFSHGCSSPSHSPFPIAYQKVPSQHPHPQLDMVGVFLQSQQLAGDWRI